MTTRAIALVALVALICATPASAARPVTTTTVDWNDPIYNDAYTLCTARGYDTGTKWDNPQLGSSEQSLAYGGFTFYAIETDSSTNAFSWRVDPGPDGGILEVAVKASTVNTFYSYSPGAFDDVGLTAADNKDVSHIIFCWNEVECVECENVAFENAPEDTTVECSAEFSADVVTATDTCDDQIEYTVSSDFTALNAILPGECSATTIITWTIDECEGRSVSQVVTVEDTTAPTINASDTYTVCDLGQDIGVNATDTCSTVSLTYKDVPIEGQQYMYTRTYTAVDGCGNTATRVVTITVGCFWCSPGYWKNHPEAWQNEEILETTYSDLLVMGVSTCPAQLPRPKRGQVVEENPTIDQILTSPNLYGGEAFNCVGDYLSSQHPDLGYSIGYPRTDNCPLS